MIYTTTQTHSLGTKAALVLGLTARALEVSADDAMGLRGATLQKALKEDAEAGLHPFVLSEYSSSHAIRGIYLVLPRLFSCNRRHDLVWSYR